MDIFCARQPIFDTERNVYGYDLNFRGGFEDYYQRLHPESAAPIPFFAFRELTDGRRGFVSLSSRVLPALQASHFPRNLVSLCLPDDFQPTGETLAHCKKLRSNGFVFVKDDITPEHFTQPWLNVLDIARVDFQGISREQKSQFCETLRRKGIKLLARNVDSTRDFEEALACGFELIQGQFYTRPDEKPETAIRMNKLVYLQVMNEVFKPSLLYDELAHLIEQDVSMSYKLLRFINSAWFGLKYEIKSIKHALVLLGPQEIKRWLSIAVIRDTGEDKPRELLLRCLSRAKLAEQIGRNLPGLSRRSSELFLMGLLSGIDALIDKPMDQVLDGLPITASIKAALLGELGGLRDVFDIILAYENGDWNAFAHGAQRLKLREQIVPEIIATALKWGNNILGEA